MDRRGLKMITQLLTVSTKHITEEEAKILEQDEFVAKDKYSFWIYIGLYEPLSTLVNDYWYKNNCPNVLDLVIYAREHQCSHLRIDCDGNEIRDFNTYEW